MLTKAQKSRVVADAMHTAQAAAQEHPDLPVPLGIRNAPTKLMKDLGYGIKSTKGFLPPELDGADFFSQL